ncbi:MAG: COG1470 family protein [Thermoleophilia bacterium]
MPAMYQWLLLAAGLIVVIILAFPPSAWAYTVEKQDDQVTDQYVVSPTKYEVEIDPGQTTYRDVTVSNRTGKTLTIEFSTEDFEGSGDPSQATVFLGDEDGVRGARQMITPEVKSIVLQQGETLTMKIKITIPKNAEPGGHYAALFASSSIKSTDESGSAINIPSGLDTLFLISVSGSIREEGSLNVPEVPGFPEYGPLEIGLVFNNSGTVHLKPAGRILITNIFGQTVAEIPVKEWVVLPEASRRTIAEWNTKYAFGRYTVEAEIYYGSDQTEVILSRSFWIIPWKIVVGVVVGLVLIILSMRLLVRRRQAGKYGLEDEVQNPREQLGSDDGQLNEPGAGTASTAPAPRYMALSELFPSMNDMRMIDVADPETQTIIRELINNQLDLARRYMGQGELEAAHRELGEARLAALRLGLLSEVSMIDGLLGGF